MNWQKVDVEFGNCSCESFKKNVLFWHNRMFYTSSHNHGNQKWVPPIWVSFHFGWYSTSMIMGERVSAHAYLESPKKAGWWMHGWLSRQIVTWYPLQGSEMSGFFGKIHLSDEKKKNSLPFREILVLYRDSQNSLFIIYSKTIWDSNKIESTSLYLGFPIY